MKTGSWASGGTDSLIINDQPLWIGGATYWFNGYIDNVRIYNRILTESEIKTHYESGK